MTVFEISLQVLALYLAIDTLERIKDNLSSSFRVRNEELINTALSKRYCQTSAYKLQYNKTCIASSTQSQKGQTRSFSFRFS